MNNLPNVIVLTFPKTGSTSLHHTFSKHPDICLPNAKETWFFEQFWDKGIQWYEDKFSHCSKKIRCDFVSTLMYHEGFTEKLKQVVSDAKFVVLLRDPIERCISHHLHQVRRGIEKESFETALNLEEERIRKEPDKFSDHALRGIGALYKSCVSELTSNFHSEQLYFILLEEIISTKKHLYLLYDFMGIRPFEEQFSRANVARMPVSRDVANLLALPGEMWCAVQQNRFLYSLVPKKIKSGTRGLRGKVSCLFENMGNAAYKEIKKPAISQHINIELIRYYNENLQGLDKMLGKDLGRFWPWFQKN